MYKGKHYNRALLKERTRELVDRYLLMHENERVHIENQLPRQEDYRDAYETTGRELSLRPGRVRRVFYPTKEAESADRLVLFTYLNYLVNAKTDEERSGWWRQAQAQAEKLGLRDYSMSILTKQQKHSVEVAA